MTMQRRPIQTLTLSRRSDTARIEINAGPGTVLGGAFSTVPRPECRLHRPEDIGAVHLAYLRAAYQDAASPVHAELQRLARMHRYGSNLIAVYAQTETIAQNVERAVLGIAARLPLNPDLEPAPSPADAPS